MKRSFFLLTTLIITLFSSCKKEETPEISLAQLPDTSAVLKYRGVFTGTSGISISGLAKIYVKDGMYKVALDSFNIENGPDLKVYLSKEYPAENFINLGSLQATSGNQLYRIPVMPDFSYYRYVLIHCQQFNHLFGIAELIPN